MLQGMLLLNNNNMSRTAAGHLQLFPDAAGQLPAVHLLPDPSFFGDGFLERLKNVVAVVPVIMTA